MSRLSTTPFNNHLKNVVMKVEILTDRKDTVIVNISGVRSCTFLTSFFSKELLARNL
jgi:hypothetical protein